MANASDVDANAQSNILPTLMNQFLDDGVFATTFSIQVIGIC